MDPYNLRMKRLCSELPKETRQKFLDLIHKGKMIGEAREACGIEELGVACAIVDASIHWMGYLSKEAQ